MRRAMYFIGLCLAMAIGIYGCGNTTTADSGSQTAAAKSAKVSFNVTFPQKNAVKSLIPSGTASVYIYWSLYNPTSASYAFGDLTLVPDANNTATASAEMEPGIYNIYADCYDSSGNLLSSAFNRAVVSSGTNNIVITFVQGRWTFVNAGGTASPITLSALSGSAALSSFDISSGYGYSEYPLSWNLNNSVTPLSSYLTYYAFSGDVSQLSSYAYAMGLPSNLPAGTTRIDALDTMYNLTDPSRSYRGSEFEGDRIFMFASVHPSQLQSSMTTTPTMTPDMTQYFNTQIASGTKLTGTIIEYTVGTSTIPVDTQKACTPSYLNQYTGAAKLASRLSKATKAAVVGSVTETYTRCEPGATGYTEYQHTTTYTDVYVYPFTATGSDLPTGSVTVTPAPAISSLSVTSGAVGAAVTISGTNFDTFAPNNAVFFNGVRAAITAATATSLSVTVPPNATSGAVTVTTAGGTATAPGSFTVSSTGGGGGGGSAGSGIAADYFTKKAVGNSWTLLQTSSVNGVAQANSTLTIALTGASGTGVDYTETTDSGTPVPGRMEINAAGDFVDIYNGVTRVYLPATFSVGTQYVMQPASGANGAMNATIAALNVTRTVPAGTFTDCVQVNYTQTNQGGVTTNATIYFSKSAGLLVEQSAVISGSGVVMLVSVQLQAGYIANP